MFKRLELKGVHIAVDDSLRSYVTKKIGRLDKYLSSHNRESAHAEVRLKETNDKGRNYTCDVTLHLPRETINVRESTPTMYSAIDIVETKLKQRIKKYKDSHTDGKLHRHLWARFNRRTA